MEVKEILNIPFRRRPKLKYYQFKYSFLFLLVSSLSTTICVGQWSIDPTVNNPICTAFGDQLLPNIVSDDSGGAIIAWTDSRSGSIDIYAQRIDASGANVWTGNGVIICSAVNNQFTLSIIADGSGGAIISWRDPRKSVFNNDIYAQRINADGDALWTTNGVAVCEATNHQTNPIMISDNNGGAIITWIDQRSGEADVYAQHINGNGIVQWAADGIPINTAIFSQFPLGIISDGFGGAIIVCTDQRNSSQDIYAQRVDANGTVQWIADGVPVCTAPSTQDHPSIVSDTNGGAIMTWVDERSGVLGGSDIYAQRIDGSGVIQWINNGVAICAAPNIQEVPAIIADGNGGAIMAWADNRSGTGYDLYAQRITTSGIMQWTTDGTPISTASGYQQVPKMTPDGNGGAIITWQDTRDNTFDIYAQRIDGNAVIQWAIDDVAISTAPNAQNPAAIIYDGTGGAIFAWEDYRNGTTNADIYSQRIPPSGIFCGGPNTPGTIVGPTAISQGSSNVYSVPIDPTATSYTWTLPSGWTGSSTTNSITTTASTISGEVKVVATNACGTSTASTLTVNVDAPVITITTPPMVSEVCTGSIALFTILANGTTNIAYQWQIFDGALFNDITDGNGYSGASTATLSINTSGNFGAGNYRCNVTGDLATSLFSNTVTLSLNPYPDALIIQSNSELTASSGDTYQWFRNGIALTDGTTQSINYNTLEYGVYKVEVTTTGCTATSPDFIYLITENEETFNQQFQAYPNPFSDQFVVNWKSNEPGELQLTNMLGLQNCFQPLQNGINELDTHALPNGIYLLTIRTGSKIISKKIIKH